MNKSQDWGLTVLPEPHQPQLLDSDSVHCRFWPRPDPAGVCLIFPIQVTILVVCRSPSDTVLTVGLNSKVIGCQEVEGSGARASKVS